MDKRQNSSGVIQSRKDYRNTPSGQYKYWLTEINAAEKRLRKWHNNADNIVNVYIDDRTGNNPNAFRRGGHEGAFRLNLFNSNVKTIMDMLYSHLPKIDVSRIDNSGNDDVARVAAEMIEKILRLEIEDNGEETDSTLKSVLQDRMLAGLGCARVRYELETDDKAPSNTQNTDELYEDEGEDDKTPKTTKKAVVQSESAPIEYYYWSDMLWGWSRSFSKLPWLAFRSYLTKDQVQTRFGQKAADGVQLKQRTVSSADDTANDADMNSAWQEAEIWEIWDKTKKQTVWLSVGYDKVLDTKKDPLGLKGFYPCPPFFLANPTTKLYKPTPDYMLAQDLYNEIDVLQTRIAIITEAVKVVGVYDASADGIKRMLEEGTENDLIPVDNWALFAEKGGIQGQVDWLPIEEIAKVLIHLISLRDDTIGLLQQVTGMADVMRGELTNQYEGVGQTEIKKEFASVRVQALQEEFARFVTDLMQLKAEVISKHFSPETIVKQSNMQFSPDREIVPEAVKLIKDPKNAICRVAIKPETMAQQDFAKLQQERSNYLAGLSTFIQAASPLIEQDPRSTPFLLEMLKWAMAGFKGSSEVEGILDQAIETMKQPQQQEQKKDPEQQKMEGQLQLEQIRAQSKEKELQMKLKNDMQIRQQDMQMDIQTKQAETQAELQKEHMKMQNELTIIAAKMEADVQTELMTSQINAEQNDRAVEGEIQKAIAVAKIKVMEVKEGKKMDMQMKLVDKAFDRDENEKDRQVERDKPAPTGAA